MVLKTPLSPSPSLSFLATSNFPDPDPIMDFILHFQGWEVASLLTYFSKYLSLLKVMLTVYQMFLNLNQVDL
jgi:hypothetical protein